uniref:Amino acid adenylation domain-containing protein n=1 Tax=Candidatus Kentrum sp. FW TaxID=2126338 RepID=A0A450TEU3_9GAMM|nr:MAG: amino acid adenylation domain-containing protein [Candidatus Kentron sp. FW]
MKSPCGAETKNLSPEEKRALLERLLREKARRIKISHPLSYGQKALWFLHRSAPDSPAYNTAAVVRILSSVDVPALRDVFQTLLARHPSLRTTFSQQDGQPVQIVHGHRDLHFERVDASMDTEEALHRRVTETHRRPFDLEQGPLLRVSLFTRAQEDHVLLIALHHIINDGWSEWMLLSEFLTRYSARRAGREAALSPLQRQYPDFVKWQTELLAGPEGERLWEYWQKQLAGSPPVLDLPTDRPRPPVQTHDGASVSFTLPGALARKLKERARASNVTLYTILLAAFQVLLHRYTGQEDILVGTPTAGRGRPEFDGICGYFVNPIVLRARLEGDPSFTAFLEQVRRTVLEGLAHQDYPFPLLVERLQPARDASRSPLFQVDFVLQKSQQDEELLTLFSGMDEYDWRVDKGGLSLTPFRMAKGEGIFDLTLQMAETRQSLSGEFKYNTDLFEAGTIERMAEHFQCLLEGIVAEPEARISRLPLLTEAERQRILIEWNDTKAPYPHDKCVHELFEEQVAKTPDAVAVIFEEEEISYGELNVRANRLAHRLRALGVEPEVLVGLFVERSMEMIVGLLGILKAGGAYVPLDPEYPRERLAFMAEDADLKVLLCHGATRERLPECAARILDMDAETTAIAGENPGNPARLAGPDNLAYVIYTSGSTGKPKGVCVEHGMITGHILNVIDLYGLKPKDRVLQFASLNFDASVGQVFGTLATGATLVPRGVEIWMPEELLYNIAHHGITIAHIPPVYVTQLLEVVSKNREILDSSGFRLLNSGGEALPSATVRLWQETVHGNRQFLNTYGPTEATVTATAFDIPKNWPGNTIIAPIGKPLPGRTVYILDQYIYPVPIGVSGELYIGGTGVARGYLNRPDLTAEKFIPDPFGDNPTGRLYRTGDLCRWLPDGNIEYLSRIDTQVKIRGFRIELGEIEATLNQHERVREAVVIALEEPENKRLVAYFVLQSYSQSPDDSETIDDVSRVEQWQQVHEGVYDQIDPDQFSTGFNTIGWNSSYSGLLIPKEEMWEWLDGTVERILSNAPKRVLEIGCGTGMLVFRIAPYCNNYTATDFSSKVLHHIEQQRKTWEFGKKVKLLQMFADNFDDIEKGFYDGVILNSVVQYFPSIDYLITVLTGAVTVLAPGGFVFIGDVRNLQLLEEFHASVQLHRANDSVSLARLKQRVQQGMRKDKELLIDPDFFIALKHHLPRITHVDIQLKSGHAHNEMTRFRYDVTLYVGGKSSIDSSINRYPQRLDWQREGLTLARTREILVKEQRDIIEFTNIPNARLITEKKVLKKLAYPAGTVAQLRKSISQSSGGMEPEAFRALTHDLPYTSYINYHGKYDYNVVFQHQSSSDLKYSEEAYSGKTDNSSRRDWHTYANHPFQDTENGYRLVPQLRDFLRQKLPDYMVPSLFVPLEFMPLTPSGKIDRRALPDPDADAFETSREYAAPRDPTEETLCGIFMEVLGMARVGIRDGFFDLGGHSLLATRAVSMIRERLGVELPLRALFEQPTPAGLAKAIIGIEGAEILPPLVPVPRDAPIRASFAQDRLWVLDRIEGGGGIAYSAPSALRLRGTLDIPALTEALSEIVARHESLRTAFAEGLDGAPVQVISPTTSISLPIESVTADRLSTRLSEEAARPFDLATGPLFRVLLFQVDEVDARPESLSTLSSHHILFVNVHHIVFDGWSRGVLLREIGELYNAQVENRSATLTDTSLQYADYAAWQRGWLTGEAMERQLDWWREHLSGAPALLELPWDRPRPAIQSFRGGLVPVVIPAELGSKLSELARRYGTTLFMVLHAAFCVLLSRLSGQTDIVAGTPIAGRRHADIENMVGLFLNTLQFRTDLSDDPPFLVLLRQVKQVLLDCYARQDVPAERIVEALNPKRSLSHPPIFQVLNILQNTPDVQVTMPGLELEPLRAAEWTQGKTAKFDLTLNLKEIPGEGITGYLEYAAVLFERSTIERWSGHFLRLLEGIVEEPETEISRLPLLTKMERQRILEEWNDTQTPYPTDKCVHELFEEQVTRDPDAVAVVFEDEKVSYGELNARANRLAHRLRALGVGPEVLVGLLNERSVEMIIGLLGILKAGGAYVPLDPEYPTERLAFMAEDADLKVLLCHGATRERLPKCTARVLDMDAEAQRIAGEDSENPEPLARPNHLAYIIYTSGSTGKPKGVMVEHKGLTNLAWVQRQAFGVTPEDRVLQFASLNFDASLEQIFSAFLGGAGLVLRGLEIWTVEECLQQVRQHNVTIAEFAPAYLHQFLESCLKDEDASTFPLQRLVTGGEALGIASAMLCQRLGLPLFNTYGPTEAAITTTNFHLSGSEKITGTTAPIGRPIANTRVYILDPRLQPVPVGVPGELYIGGVGVARGYLNRPELTAERFISDPFSDDPDARLYRTGDSCRWLPDDTIAKGNIEFLGRIDTQVKIRGFRIECGEVENALLAYRDVREAVVDARGEGVDKRLVAWVVADVAGRMGKVAPGDVPIIGEEMGTSLRDFAHPTDELRAHLRARLPDWMVPTRFVFVDSLPLTPSGKIDRRALPDPDADAFETSREYMAPRDSVEDAICAVFAEVLGVARVSVHDNFFALGGHSLSAVKALSSIDERLGVKLPLRALFECPTLAEVAMTVREGKEWQPAILFPLKTNGSRPPLFCVHPVGGGAFCYRELADCLPEDRTVHGIQAIGFEGKEAPLTDIETMAARYVEGITALCPDGPYHLYGWSFGGVVAFEMAQQLRTMGREVGLLVLADTVHPSWFQGKEAPGEERIIAHLLAEAGAGEVVMSNETGEMSPADRIAHLRQQLASGSNLAGLGDIDRFIRIYQTNFQALSEYRTSIWEGEMVFLSARERLGTDEKSVDSDWRNLTRKLARHVIPGNHFTMHRQPNVHRIAEILGNLN